MTKLLLIIFTFAYSESSPSLGQGGGCPFGVNVGQNCGSTAFINAYQLCPVSWPPTAGLVEYVWLFAIITNTVTTSEIVMGTCLNSMFWTYVPQDYYATLDAGDSISIGFPFTFPTQPGSYESNIQIVANSQHISCWQFSYNIY